MDVRLGSKITAKRVQRLQPTVGLSLTTPNHSTPGQNDDGENDHQKKKDKDDSGKSYESHDDDDDGFLFQELFRQNTQYPQPSFPQQELERKSSSGSSSGDTMNYKVLHELLNQTRAARMNEYAEPYPESSFFLDDSFLRTNLTTNPTTTAPPSPLDTVRHVMMCLSQAHDKDQWPDAIQQAFQYTSPVGSIPRELLLLEPDKSLSEKHDNLDVLQTNRSAFVARKNSKVRRCKSWKWGQPTTSTSATTASSLTRRSAAETQNPETFSSSSQRKTDVDDDDVNQYKQDGGSSSARSHSATNREGLEQAKFGQEVQTEYQFLLGCDSFRIVTSPPPWSLLSCSTLDELSRDDDDLSSSQSPSSSSSFCHCHLDVVVQRIEGIKPNYYDEGVRTVKVLRTYRFCLERSPILRALKEEGGGQQHGQLAQDDGDASEDGDDNVWKIYRLERIGFSFHPRTASQLCDTDI